MTDLFGRRLHRSWVAVSLVALLLTGCKGSDKDDDAIVTVPTAPSTTTTTAIDVSTVPETITVEYVQAVMNELDRVTGDAVRVFVAAKGPNAEFIELLKAVYDEPAFSLEEAEYGRDAANDLEDLRSSPGNPRTEVRRIVDASRTCIVAEVNRTFGEVLKATPPPDTLDGVVQLTAKKPERDPKGKNRTAWSIVADAPAKDAQVPENPCK